MMSVQEVIEVLHEKAYGTDAGSAAQVNKAAMALEITAKSVQDQDLIDCSRILKELASRSGDEQNESDREVATFLAATAAQSS